MGSLRNALWVCPAMLAMLVSNGAQADVLVMKNGDRVTGAVVKKDGATITIKSTSFGVITAPWDEVVSLEAGGELTVVTKSGKTIRGPVLAPLPEIVTIRNADEQHAWERLQSPSWFELWTGAANIG